MRTLTLRTVVCKSRQISNDIFQRLFIDYPFISKLVLCNSSVIEKHKIMSIFWIQVNIKETSKKEWLIQHILKLAMYC